MRSEATERAHVALAAGAAALVGQGQFRKIEFLEPMPPLGGAGQVPTRRARLTTDLPGILPGDPPTRFSQELVLEGIGPTGSIANTPTNIAEKAFVSEVSLKEAAARAPCSSS